LGYLEAKAKGKRQKAKANANAGAKCKCSGNGKLQSSLHGDGKKASLSVEMTSVAGDGDKTEADPYGITNNKAAASNSNNSTATSRAMPILAEWI
jgi:hypothetical protein